MVATETMISGWAGRMSSANSFPAVSAKATPWSTQMSRAMVSWSESGTNGRFSAWLPTMVEYVRSAVMAKTLAAVAEVCK